MDDFHLLTARHFRYEYELATSLVSRRKIFSSNLDVGAREVYMVQRITKKNVKHQIQSCFCKPTISNFILQDFFSFNHASHC